ncbi:MAG TPA: hypothetical protein IAB62_08470 [Candidatus Coprocola pullicola]|nr:hypothetical protein [Candidatus Coprocola pullicola]
MSAANYHKKGRFA